MIDPNDLKTRDLLDYLAWKAAKGLGWSVSTARWRIGIRRQGEYTSLIVYSMTPAKRLKNFNSLQASALDILVPATSDERKWLGCILMASQASPIYVGAVEILPMRPCLEKILLEMDVEGWSPLKYQEKEEEGSIADDFARTMQ